jgi:hypothetical protein
MTPIEIVTLIVLSSLVVLGLCAVVYFFNKPGRRGSIDKTGFF